MYYIFFSYMENMLYYFLRCFVRKTVILVLFLFSLNRTRFVLNITSINFAICGAPCSRAALAALWKATRACEFYSWFSCLPVVVFAAFGSQYSVNMAIARMVVRNFTRCAFRVVLGANRKRCYGLTLHIASTCWLLSDEASRTRDKLL